MSQRTVNIPARVTTENGLVQSFKIQSALKNYPQILQGKIDSFSGKQMIFAPDGTPGFRYIRMYFEKAAESLALFLTDTWTLDLSTSIIDMDTKTGGIIDGLTFENGRQYLFWGFLNLNQQWAGIGFTRKPYESFSTFTGTANKGDISTFNLGASTAYQFTEGAQVIVRTDSNLTNGVGQWNWGTILAILNQTDLSIELDNNANYGFNITAIGGVNEIVQMDSFQPYIVSPTDQQLYAPNFRLLGEVYTDAGSGDIIEAYKADDEFRKIEVNNDYSLIWEVTTNQAATVSSARYIPLWANQASFTLYGNDGTPGDVLTLADTSAQIIIYGTTPGGEVDQFINGTGFISLEQYCNLYITSQCTSASQAINLTGYRVPGGMRL